MTLNAITTACNQKQNRNPVMSLSEAKVSRTAREVEELELVTLAPASPGSPSNRFKHRVTDKLVWYRPQRAIMTEFLLRGPTIRSIGIGTVCTDPPPTGCRRT